MSARGEITYRPLERVHAEGVLELCRELDWPSYSRDADTSYAVLTAPGATTVVALDGELVVGLAHVFGDGQIQALLALLGVRPGHRRRGIARQLVERAFRGAGGQWLDLAAEPGSEDFYRSFDHAEKVGFRLYPASRAAPVRR